MAFYSGTDGQLYIDGQRAAQVRSWSFTSSVATLDTTTLGDTDRTAVAGVRSTSGNCSLFYYQGSPGGGGSASELLRKVVKARSSGAEDGVAPIPENVRMKLRVADGTTLGRYVEGDCVITSVAMTMAVGEVLSADVAFEFVGAPIEVVL